MLTLSIIPTSSPICENGKKIVSSGKASTSSLVLLDKVVAFFNSEPILMSDIITHSNSENTNCALLAFLISNKLAKELSQRIIDDASKIQEFIQQTNAYFSRKLPIKSLPYSFSILRNKVLDSVSEQDMERELWAFSYMLAIKPQKEHTVTLMLFSFPDEASLSSFIGLSWNEKLRVPHELLPTLAETDIDNVVWQAIQGLPEKKCSMPFKNQLDEKISIFCVKNRSRPVDINIFPDEIKQLARILSGLKKLATDIGSSCKEAAEELGATVLE
ncbi:MAG: hypothetical protein N2654_06175 [Deltaproteobacteria bacterium]|nr:hypothetical protein [Deltaproteobacteria bacterium]